MASVKRRKATRKGEKGEKGEKKEKKDEYEGRERIKCYIVYG